MVFIGPETEKRFDRQNRRPRRLAADDVGVVVQDVHDL
jgi:hypothetical protein